MGSPWQFATDAKSDAFCREIVSEMGLLFGASEEEAVGRINGLWRGRDILDQDDIVCHEMPDYWARVMCLGKESLWWIIGDERERLGLKPIVPKPYP